jgi:putative oxidoreductase
MFPRFSPTAYALLRIVAGLMFALHGSAKLLGFPESMGHQLPPLMMAAGVIELVGGLMIAFGVFASCAAFVASGEMAVAYFMGHMAKGGFWPTVNKGELAVLYCFVFLYIAATGPGIWSVTRK